MKVTNDYDMPIRYYRAVTIGQRVPKRGKISATEMIGPPRQRRLKLDHWDDLVADCSDFYFAFMGDSVHLNLEKYCFPTDIAERRMKMDYCGWELGGTPDVVSSNGELIDFKTTSLWSFLKGVKAEWEAQLNIYRWMYGQTKSPKDPEIVALEIDAYFRDWQSIKAKYDSSHKYPKAGAKTYAVPMWTMQEAREYINQRLYLHRQAEDVSKDSLLDIRCSPDEMWESETVYAIHKGKNKKAIPNGLFKDELEAEKKAEELGTQFKVQVRPGYRKRCEDGYCVVADKCCQRKEYNENVKAGNN